jgi:hypothetical protein
MPDITSMYFFHKYKHIFEQNIQNKYSISDNRREAVSLQLYYVICLPLACYATAADGATTAKPL